MVGITQQRSLGATARNRGRSGAGFHTLPVAARTGPQRRPAFCTTHPSHSRYRARAFPGADDKRRATAGAMTRLSSVGTRNTAPQKVYLQRITRYSEETR